MSREAGTARGSLLQRKENNSGSERNGNKGGDKSGHSRGDCFRSGICVAETFLLIGALQRLVG